MVLPGLASALPPPSPASTLAPETPLVLPSTVPAKPMPKGPPTVAAPKPRPPSREQVQREVDAIMRDVEDKRAKRSKQQQQLHDDMLSAIFKSVFEDTVPDSAVGIYSSGEKDRMGCTVPKVIDFRSLPVPVQDNLMRAEILPTMWPRYRISGHERMFHYCLMTVTRKQMLLEAESHSLSVAAIENMYPAVRDKEHREWINSMMYSPDGPADAVDQLIYSAFECALSILRAAGSAVISIGGINPYQLDLFLFKDMGIGGILSKFIGRMNDPEIGRYENYNLPEPVATWYGSFYTDYMAYLDTANLDSVLAAQVASPGSQITIQFIALALEEAEERARDSDMTLNEFLENRTIADIVDQFIQEENCAWLAGNDFFMGNNGHFAPIRKVPMMPPWLSLCQTSPWLMQKEPQPRVLRTQQRLLMSQVPQSRQPHHRRQLVYRALRHQHRGQSLEQKHHQGFSLPLRTSSRMSSTRHQARSGLLSRTFLNSFRIRRRHSLKRGSTQQTTTAVIFGLTWSMLRRPVIEQEGEFISSVVP